MLIFRNSGSLIFSGIIKDVDPQEFSKMLIELTKEPQIGSKAIDLVKMDVSEDAYDLIIDIVAGFDPTALEIIKEDWL